MPFDRYANDAQDAPLDLVDICAADGCHVGIYRHDECIQDENGDLFCSDRCFIKSMGAVRIYAGTEMLA